MTNKMGFEVLATARIQDKRNLVISSNTNGGFTIAQQIVVQEGKRQTLLFIKGAIHVDSLEGLVNLRNALSDAIEEYEVKQDIESYKEFHNSQK